MEINKHFIDFFEIVPAFLNIIWFPCVFWCHWLQLVGRLVQKFTTLISVVNKQLQSNCDCLSIARKGIFIILSSVRQKDVAQHIEYTVKEVKLNRFSVLFYFVHHISNRTIRTAQLSFSLFFSVQNFVQIKINANEQQQQKIKRTKKKMRYKQVMKLSMTEVGLNFS